MADTTGEDLPSVAVVIPTRGRADALSRCLLQLLPYVDMHPECSIVVSDDGNAADTSAAMGIEFYGVRFLQGPRRGPAANRNSGVAHSEGELLVFLDDDCEPCPHLIGEYQRAALQFPDCGVFEGRISAKGVATSFADSAPCNETGGFLWSCNFAVRRCLFNAVGGFDERFPFPAMEDVELHFRLANKSLIRFLPEARVFHAYEKRTGWKGQRHHALSVLLYLHLHGLKATNRGPKYFLRATVRAAGSGGMRLLRGEVAKDPQHLMLIFGESFLIFFITCIWRLHPYLASKIFPACCAGCSSLHASLAENAKIR